MSSSKPLIVRVKRRREEGALEAILVEEGQKPSQRKRLRGITRQLAAASLSSEPSPSPQPTTTTTTTPSSHVFHLVTSVPASQVRTSEQCAELLQRVRSCPKVQPNFLKSGRERRRTMQDTKREKARSEALDKLRDVNSRESEQGLESVFEVVDVVQHAKRRRKPPARRVAYNPASDLPPMLPVPSPRDTKPQNSVDQEEDVYDLYIVQDKAITPSSKLPIFRTMESAIVDPDAEYDSWSSDDNCSEDSNRADHPDHEYPEEESNNGSGEEESSDWTDDELASHTRFHSSAWRELSRRHRVGKEGLCAEDRTLMEEMLSDDSDIWIKDGKYVFNKEAAEHPESGDSSDEGWGADYHDHVEYSPEIG